MPPVLFFASPRSSVEEQRFPKPRAQVRFLPGASGCHVLPPRRTAATASRRELTPSAQEMPDVVLDRLGTQVELLGDLLGRASLLEQVKHLGLPGCEVRGGALGSSSAAPDRSPKTPTTRSPSVRGTALTSSTRRAPPVETSTPVVSVAAVVPSTLRANSSRARVRSSAPTTVVKCRPRTSPRRRSAAGLIHRTMPSRSST
jgi:hypothetical protein